MAAPSWRGSEAPKCTPMPSSLITAWPEPKAPLRGGTTVTVGLPHPERMLSIPAVSLVAEERTLKGSYLGSCVPARDIPRFIELYQRGRLPVDRLLTDTLALDEINLGFDRLARGQGVRQAVLF